MRNERFKNESVKRYGIEKGAEQKGISQKQMNLFTKQKQTHRIRGQTYGSQGK